MLKAIGKYVVIKAYVNSNHEVNTTNRSLHSGIIIYVNNEPIIWYSKCKNIVEASRFVSNFVALGIDTYIIEVLRYKSSCLGVLVYGPVEVFFDTKSVVNNLSITK